MGTWHLSILDLGHIWRLQPGEHLPPLPPACGHNSPVTMAAGGWYTYDEQRRQYTNWLAQAC